MVTEYCHIPRSLIARRNRVRNPINEIYIYYGGEKIIAYMNGFKHENLVVKSNYLFNQELPELIPEVVIVGAVYKDYLKHKDGVPISEVFELGEIFLPVDIREIYKIITKEYSRIFKIFHIRHLKNE
jgi:hypothetical protein